MPPVASADIVLMTHNHYDHNAARVIQGNHTDVLSREGKFTVKGLHVEGIRVPHDYSDGSERGDCTMYLFEMEGMTVCHCGDLGCIPNDEIIDKIRGVDFLMVPVGEVFTLKMDDIHRFIELVNPNVIIPMHYRVGGLSLPVTPLDEFLEMIPEDAIDYMGNEVEVSKEDLELKECWVFDR